MQEGENPTVPALCWVTVGQHLGSGRVQLPLGTWPSWKLSLQTGFRFELVSVSLAEVNHQDQAL